MRRPAALLLSALALALVPTAPAWAETPPPRTTPCPMPKFLPLVAGQEGWVPVDYFCPPDADRDPSYWDLTVDFGDGTTGKGPYTQGYMGATHTYAAPGEYAVSAVLRDTRTGETRTFTGRRTVTAPPAPPAPPTSPPAAQPPVSTPCAMATPVPPPLAGQRGAVVVAQHCPPDADRDPANFTVRIDFGDGTAAAGRRLTPENAWLVAGDHTYRKPGAYTVKAIVRDKRTGVETPYTTRVTIRAALKAVRTGDEPRFTVGRLGTSQTLVTFRHVDPRATAKDLRATIRWGDGRSSRGTVRALEDGRFAVLGRHRYRKMRTARITVTVTDAKGGRLTLRTTGLVGRVYDKLPTRR